MAAPGAVSTVSWPSCTSGSSVTSTCASALPPMGIDWLDSLNPAFRTTTLRVPMSTTSSRAARGERPTLSLSTSTSAPGSLTVSVSFTVSVSMVSMSVLASARSASVSMAPPAARYCFTSVSVRA